jgi:hypothetical protein
VKAILFIVLVAGAACGSDNTPTVCDARDVPAIWLTVRDAQSGVFIGSHATVIVTRHGGATDTLVKPVAGDSDRAFIGDLPGTYDLIVKNGGYADWLKGNIVVQATDGGCHPITIDVEADLQKLP